MSGRLIVQAFVGAVLVGCAAPEDERVGLSGIHAFEPTAAFLAEDDGEGTVLLVVGGPPKRGTCERRPTWPDLVPASCALMAESRYRRSLYARESIALEAALGADADAEGWRVVSGRMRRCAGAASTDGTVYGAAREVRAGRFEIRIGYPEDEAVTSAMVLPDPITDEMLGGFVDVVRCE